MPHSPKSVPPSPRRPTRRRAASGARRRRRLVEPPRRRRVLRRATACRASATAPPPPPLTRRRCSRATPAFPRGQRETGWGAFPGLGARERAGDGLPRCGSARAAFPRLFIKKIRHISVQAPRQLASYCSTDDCQELIHPRTDANGGGGRAAPRGGVPMAGVRPHAAVPRALQAPGRAWPRRHLPRHAKKRRPAPSGARAPGSPPPCGFFGAAGGGGPAGGRRVHGRRAAGEGWAAQEGLRRARPLRRLPRGGLRRWWKGGKGEGWEKRPDWILLDFAQYWLGPIADEHKVPCAIFHIFSAAVLVFLGSEQVNLAHPRTTVEDFMVPPSWIPFPSTIAFRRHEAKWIAQRFQPDASGVSDVDRMRETEQNCRLLIYRSCHKAEPRLFPLLTDIYHKPNIPAGLLLPTVDTGTAHSDVIEWLDRQPAKSVIYVALGSEAPLTMEIVHELALGLELSGVRFLWALRKPSGMFNVDDNNTLLPNGFEERIQERGVVCTGWVPQVRVLAHQAVGAFLTHCGWGSTVENFRFGHPLVMLPFITDQGIIARAMVEKKIGVEVERNEEDGSFGRDGIARAVRLVMVEEEGRVFACNAKQLQEVLGDNARQEHYVDKLVEHLRRYKDGTC